MKEEDALRAHYLMSPYNVTEAKRAREFRRAVIVLTTASIALLVAGVVLAVLRG